MEEADVVDKFKLVYLTFMLHGIGVLMPWNMFITAVGVRKSSVNLTLKTYLKSEFLLTKMNLSQ